MPREIHTELGPDNACVDDWNTVGSSNNITAAAQVMAAGGAGTRHYISSFIISADAEMSVQIQDDTTGTANVAIENLYLPANGTVVSNFPPGRELKMGADNKDIDIIADTSGAVSWTLIGYKTRC